MGDKKDLFITVELGDVKNGKVEITEEKFHFSGTKTDGKKEVKYKIDFTFKNPVNAKESIHAFKDREVEIKVRKKDVKADFWLLMYSKEDKKYTNPPVNVTGTYGEMRMMMVKNLEWVISEWVECQAWVVVEWVEWVECLVWALGESSILKVMKTAMMIYQNSKVQMVMLKLVMLKLLKLMQRARKMTKKKICLN